MKSIIALSLFLSSAAAILTLPDPTPVTANKLVASTFGPAPTSAPSEEELRKRQALALIPNLIIAPNNTCGFENGVIESAVDWLCPSGRCGFATTPGHTGDMYCCGKASTASCEKRWTACVDSASITAVCTGNGCDSIQTVLCTSSAYPYCGRGYFSGLSVSVLYCASTPYSTDDTYLTSWIGHAAVTFTAATTTSSESSSSTSSSSSSSSSFSSSSSTTPTPTPTPVAESKSKPPIGPIVGGTIGGVAVIAFVVVAVMFLLRSKKRDAKSEGPNHPPPFVQDHAAGAQGYNPYSPQPEKAPPAFQQHAYAPPMSPAYSQASSPPQQYSGQASSPQQYTSDPNNMYGQQRYSTPHDGAGIPQELNSHTTSPRPESQISQNPVPTYVPYQPPVDHDARIHEVQ